jgi:Sigma-70, region 4
VVAVDAVSFTPAAKPAAIGATVATLSEREAGIVRLRFGLTDGQPRTHAEISRIYGITRERIRQNRMQDHGQAAAPLPLQAATRLPQLGRYCRQRTASNRPLDSWAQW